MLRPSAVALTLAFPLALFAADGDLDDTFSTDGKDVQTWNGERAFAYSVAATADGSILVGGSVGDASDDFAVMRYRADGAIDTSFGDLGFTKVAFDIGGSEYDQLHAVVPLTSGKVLLVGQAQTAAVFLPAVARLTAAGELDPDFGAGGKVVFDVLPDANTEVQILDAALQSNGMVVLLGTATPSGGSNDRRIFLLRIDENGSPDLTFSSDGWTLLDFPSEFNESASALEIDVLGKIHVGGSTGLPDYRPLYARVGPTGISELLSVVDLDLDWVTDDLAIDPVSGAVLLSLRDADFAFDAGAVVRLDIAGELDPTFGTAGIAELALEDGSYATAIEVQSDRKIAIAGSINHTGTQRLGFLLARLLPDGTRDNSFDGNGVVRYEFDREVDAQDAAFALTLSGGRIVAAGYAALLSGHGAFAILRTQSALIFTDGFERGSASGWLGN